MVSYFYKARDESGKSLKGTMEAATRDELAAKLRKMGYVPTFIKEVAPGMQLESLMLKFQIIRVEDIIVFNLQLANMIDSGLTILSSLDTIHKQIENKKLKGIIEEVRRSVEGGSSFSEALAKYPHVFSKLFVSMVKAGEASGNLNAILNRLASYTEQKEDLRQKIRTAMFYPTILLVAGLGVIIFIISFVIPKFVDIFTRAEVSLPMPTLILYSLGLALKRFWYFFIFAIIGIVMSLRLYLRSGTGKLFFDRLILRIPVIGPLVRKVVVSRLTRTLATLVDSGVPILESLEITKDVVGNEIFRRVIMSARSGIEQGDKIAPPLKVSSELPEDAIQMIAVGEETGKLGYMLNKIADFYDTAVGYAIKKLTALIEPVFLVIMGVIVAFIMASMLMPIFDMVKTLRH